MHLGHLILANYLAEETALDEVWFVITPQSPFKQNKRLLDNHHRLALVEEAIEDYPKLKVSTVEFEMDPPQYTALSVARLTEKHSELVFSLIMGEDNLKHFHKWHNYEHLLAAHKIYVYPRHMPAGPAQAAPTDADTNRGLNVSTALLSHPNIVSVDAPVISISSSYIRKAHKAGKNVRPLLPPAVWAYMDEMNFYR